MEFDALWLDPGLHKETPAALMEAWTIDLASTEFSVGSGRKVVDDYVFLAAAGWDAVTQLAS